MEHIVNRGGISRFVYCILHDRQCSFQRCTCHVAGPPCPDWSSFGNFDAADVADARVAGYGHDAAADDDGSVANAGHDAVTHVNDAAARYGGPTTVNAYAAANAVGSAERRERGVKWIKQVCTYG